MIKQQLSTLKEITDLRTVWPNEATDFTPWLAQDDNIAMLSDVIGIEITVEETESNVGSFATDIFATETDTGQKIIIENQLEETNHDHLGKIITYASGKDANYIIWIVKHAREEHKAAIEWLNAHTDDDVGFFLCEIKLFQIDKSNYAPKIIPIEVPNDWSRATKTKSGSLSPIQQERFAFWAEMNDYVFKDNDFSKQFKKQNPTYKYWYILSIGTSKAHMAFIRTNTPPSVAVEFYIHNDKKFYDSLYANKNDIEKIAGIHFNWQRLDDKKASRINIVKEFPIDNRDDWINEYDWLIDAALKMKKAILKYI